MDIISLIAGVVIALLLGLLIYTQRRRLLDWRSRFQRSASSTRARLARGVEARYRDAVIEQANGWHLAGHLVPLEQIAIIPRFYGLPQPYNPLEDEAGSVFDNPLNLLPLTPDWPQAIGPYQMPGLPLDQVLRGEGGLAVLGTPGRGASVALALMAILAARQIDDDQPGGLLNEVRTPLLIHLADVDLSPESLGMEPDPLTPLFEAARQRLGVVIGRIIGAIRGQFASGYGLILADGWDELPPTRRRQVVTWLRALMAAYPGNKLVVAGPAQGYGPLLELGLAPVFVMPWSNREVAELARLWASVWPEIAGTRRNPAPAPDDNTLRRVVRGNHARSPLDITLKIWAGYAGDDPGAERPGWYAAYVSRVIPAPEGRPALERAARSLLDVPGEMGLPAEQMTAYVGEALSAIQRPPISPPDFVYAITHQTHLLVERPGRRLVFRHPLIAAYLAAEALRDSPHPVEALLDDHPAVALTMPFLAGMLDVSPYLERRLAEDNTLLHDNLLSLAAWTVDADPKAPWCGAILKRLAQAFLAPAEFLLVRERLMAALVASRDPNVGFVFRQGLRHPEPPVRLLSVIGLGALGDPQTVIELSDRLADDEPDVQAATALALGAIGSKAALDYLIQALLSGSELTRRAVAEMLATNTAGEGHDILREALQETDASTRRAAIYGLQRVNEAWVAELLQDAQRHEHSWQVRDAATAALEALQNPHGPVPHPLPRPEGMPWLVAWAETYDRGVTSDQAAISTLVRMLEEGDDRYRLAAAELLGALGRPEGVRPLYSALREEHPQIREAVYRALGQASAALGHPLPGVS